MIASFVTDGGLAACVFFGVLIASGLVWFMTKTKPCSGNCGMRLSCVSLNDRCCDCRRNDRYREIVMDAKRRRR